MGRGQIYHVLSNPVYAGRIRHKEQVQDGVHDAIIDPGRWEAVQTRLVDKSAKPRCKPAAAHPSPLAGKLFDETGDRLTPSHASKGGKRYRYYVSRRLVTGDGDAGNGWRLPAARVERDLANAVKAHLRTCINHGDIAARTAGSETMLRSVVETLGDGCLDLVFRAKLEEGSIAIALDPGKTADALQVPQNIIPPEALSLHLQFSQRRRGVESRLIIGAAQSARDDILIANIARAAQWRVALCSGDDLACIAARWHQHQVSRPDAVLRLPVAEACPGDPGRSSATCVDHELAPPPWSANIMGRTGPHHSAVLSNAGKAKSTPQTGL